MSGVGPFLWIAYLAVVLVFALEITLIVLRSREIERFIGDLGEESEAPQAEPAAGAPDSGLSGRSGADATDAAGRASPGGTG